MRVIFITREGYQFAGARIRCYNFARELEKQGISAQVYSFADKLGAKCGEGEYQMPLRVKLKYNWYAFRELIKEDKNSFFFLQRFNYHALAPLLTSLLRRNKVIFDCDDWNIREDPRYYLGFPVSKMEYLTRETARHSTACVVASHFLKDYLKPFNEKLEYIPTGVDTNFFLPAKKEDNPKVVFFWTGTVFHSQMRDNLLFILSCFEEIARLKEEVFLKIAGCGKYYRELKVKAASFKCRQKIEFSDWVHPDSMPKYLAGVDVGLLPLSQNSRFNQAKSPTKLFEYMAMAKPTIASFTGEAAFVLESGKTGFLAKNKAEFISCMFSLAQDKLLRQEMGRRAREKVLQAYSLDFLGKKLAGFIKSL